MMNDLTKRTTVVVGASRGLGRGIATGFAEAGAPVVAVARSAAALAELEAAHGGIEVEVADATDAAVAATVLDRHAPTILIIAAGASPLMRPLQNHTWDTFSSVWNTDVRITFNWLRVALLTPLPPGSRVIVLSSGAALNGSPLSGGYAGAKATQRFLTAYAQEEAQRAGLDIAFTAVLPQLTPATELGLSAVRAYAARAGRTVEDHVRQLGDLLTPEIAAAALLELVDGETAALAPAYRLSGTGLHRL
jgi:NAD(P)-dependent dehydrogenase (short-subunit alcohol dehydrogenase family)